VVLLRTNPILCRRQAHGSSEPQELLLVVRRSQGLPTICRVLDRLVLVALVATQTEKRRGRHGWRHAGLCLVAHLVVAARGRILWHVSQFSLSHLRVEAGKDTQSSHDLGVADTLDCALSGVGYAGRSLFESKLAGLAFVFSAI